MLSMSVATMAQNRAVTGDVNGDGYVTTSDVTAIYNYLLLGDETYVATCDVDGDGYITVADVTAVYNIILGGTVVVEHEYVDLGLPSGTLWATMNIGANSPEEYGDFFAWGETTPKVAYDWSNYQWCNGTLRTMTKYCTQSNYGNNGLVDGKTELDPEDDAATANWGSNWCMPTKAQQDELRSQCTWQWTTSNGVKGYRVSKNGKSLFLPAAGYYFTTLYYRPGEMGYYWSRTLGSSRSYYANYIYFYSMNGSTGFDGFYGDRDSGFSVRAVRVSQ